MCSIHTDHLLNQETLLPAKHTLQKQHQQSLGHDLAVQTELSPLELETRYLQGQPVLLKSPTCAAYTLLTCQTRRHSDQQNIHSKSSTSIHWDMIQLCKQS